MTESEKLRMEEARKELALRNPWAIPTRQIIEAGYQLHEKINDIGGRDEKFWKWVKKNPEEVRLKVKSFDTFFSKLQPARDPDSGRPRRVSADELEQEGHSEEEIARLAFGGQEGEKG
jgi:hypothetical protein